MLVGGFVAWRVLSARGPEIEITFKSAEGLEAGKTQVKYKDVEIGVVESVDARAGPLGRGRARRAWSRARDDYLRETARFWIVKPRIAGGQVSGLGTLLSGAYIGMDPVLEGKRVTTFTGLEVPPVVTLQEAGKYFVLRSRRAGAIDVGTPVFFRKISVGQVVSSELDDDGRLRHHAHLRARAVRRARAREQPLLGRERLQRDDQRERCRDRHGVDHLDPGRRHRVRRARRTKASRRPRPRRVFDLLREPRGREPPRLHASRRPTCCTSTSPCAA